MKLYYTGATAFQGEQSHAVKSLGGYVSKNPIPNGSLEAFFSDVSETSVQRDLTEYRCFALKNETNADITAVNLAIIYPEVNYIDIVISAIAPSIDSKGGVYFEQVPNMRTSPMSSTQYVDPSCQFSSCVLELLTPAQKGEIITILGVSTKPAPADLTLEETYYHIEKAFSVNQQYNVEFINKTEYIYNTLIYKEEVKITQNLSIKNNDLNPITDPVTFTTTGTCTPKDLPSFEGGYDNSVNLGELKKGEYIGIWFRKDLDIFKLKNKPVPAQKNLDVEDVYENITLSISW